MPDILELALRHVIAHGMTKEDGATMLAAFAKGEGVNIDWSETAQRLPKELADRIDRAGTSWMLTHKPAVTILDIARDGKMLATGEGH